MVYRLEFPRNEHAPGAARRAIADMRATMDASTYGDVQLLLSELVSNSVTHGDGESVIVLVDDDVSGKLRCEVIDEGRGFVPRAREGRMFGGWGLDLVEQIASSWGVREGSTHVWFELRTDTTAA